MASNRNWISFKTLQQKIMWLRYAVASRDLKAGEEILSEIPFVVGPKSHTPPVCLGCLVRIDCSVLCKKCGWPVCSESCSEGIFHLSECRVFSVSGARFQKLPEGVEDGSLSAQYQCVTPLRVLLNMEEDGERWRDQLGPMQSHCQSRKTTKDWATEYVNVVGYLRKVCKLANRFDEALIHRICGLLEVNSFEVPTACGWGARAVYPFAAVLSHNCVANTAHTVHPHDNFRLKLRTTVDVPAGGELFCSYTSSLSPTLARREALNNGKYFWCDCSRCSDPTECNTYLGAVMCSACIESTSPGVLLSNNPLDPESDWGCTHCNANFPGVEVQRLVDRISEEVESEVDSLPFGPEKLGAAERAMKKYGSVLHANHALNIGLAHTLIQLYGRVEGYAIQELPEVLLERKVQLCRRLLNVLDVVEPGLTRIRGLTLYEYHLALLILARSKFERNTLGADQFKDAILEVRDALKESVKTLCLEPESSHEGLLGRRSSESLKQLQESIEDL